MKRRFTSNVLLVAAIVACLHALLPTHLMAQEAKSQDTPRPTQSDDLVSRDPSGRITVKFQRGQRLYVDNATSGPIVVVGWDNDYIEAFAVSDRGAEEVRFRFEPGKADISTISLVAQYGTREGNEFFRSPFEEVTRASSRLKGQLDEFWGRTLDRGSPKDTDRSRPRAKEESSQKAPETLTPPTHPPVEPLPILTQPPDVQAAYSYRPGEIFFELKVPRYVELEVIKVFRSEVLVSGLASSVFVDGDRSTIRLARIASAEVRTRTGNVEIDTVTGLADVITSSGAILVRNAGADVRALSVSGRIEVQCAKGRVDASNTDGPITLTGVTGDVSATATYSSLRVSGRLRADGHYYLKSMSGSVQMEAPENVGGFTASLTSYRGGVESDFPLKSRDAVGSTSAGRRLSGRFGDGRAQITLDSFDGTVRLAKVAAAALGDCK
ncbi:MAG: hypothetical protein ABI882_06730 [Acidobacteriota bacterium]